MKYKNYNGEEFEAVRFSISVPGLFRLAKEFIGDKFIQNYDRDRFYIRTVNGDIIRLEEGCYIVKYFIPNSNEPFYQIHTEENFNEIYKKI